jgi:hypothetical protein
MKTFNMPFTDNIKISFKNILLNVTVLNQIIFQTISIQLRKSSFPLIFALLSFITGLIFVNILDQYQDQVVNSLGGNSDTFTFIDQVIYRFVSSIHFILLLITPLFTINSFKDDDKLNTIIWFQYFKIPSWIYVLSKYCSSLILALLALSPVYFIFFLMFIMGFDDYGLILSNIFSLVFSFILFISVGVLVGSFIKVTVLNIMTTFVFCLFFYMANWFAQSNSNILISEIFSYIGVISHIEELCRGMVKVSSIFYFVSLIFLFLTTAVFYQSSKMNGKQI